VLFWVVVVIFKYLSQSCVVPFELTKKSSYVWSGKEIMEPDSFGIGKYFLILHIISFLVSVTFA
jgi:hypothetical protein